MCMLLRSVCTCTSLYVLWCALCALCMVNFCKCLVTKVTIYIVLCDVGVCSVLCIILYIDGSYFACAPSHESAYANWEHRAEPKEFFCGWLKRLIGMPYAEHFEIMYLYHFARLRSLAKLPSRECLCVSVGISVYVCGTKNNNDERQNIRTWIIVVSDIL